MTPQAALDRGLDELALAMPAGARERLLAYIALLAKWNRTYNLTAIRDPLRMVTHHLLDSLAVVPHLPLGAGASLADAGSGAGLPGIPIALARPDWRVTLNDASAKKAAFLRQAAIELALSNVEIYQGRTETWRPAQRFAGVISRAFAGLAEFIAACRHLVAPGGVLAAMKGAAPGAELARVPRDCDCSEVVRLRVPLLRAERHLVLCRPAA
ncbi:MAG: 16S rRNA (guanine(527)-N(7))-methyltransferase [Betaproteobacteria bacterium RIFCSPHIGHO2_12_FULL_69_13]|nr:MAG: 16S rRNA (guanine(527)-N(7))-methyltransferase [Betaproteobacteria bacterium RIFCSPHIGHO2_12_FULL_69_13]OGA65214.1 MAG: 16S rRNA (guanine(527)-N(7))-methyltransferase [Betaproteobacteria bacterium RIFCSPLOWO2_12_FULL_68_20]